LGTGSFLREKNRPQLKNFEMPIVNKFGTQKIKYVEEKLGEKNSESTSVK
jgi:hypothetical protein